jgi:hypothetical protein
VVSWKRVRDTGLVCWTESLGVVVGSNSSERLYDSSPYEAYMRGFHVRGTYPY